MKQCYHYVEVISPASIQDTPSKMRSKSEWKRQQYFMLIKFRLFSIEQSFCCKIPMRIYCDNLNQIFVQILIIRVKGKT